jgi:hypothetical protein
MADTKIKAGQFFGVVGHGTDGYFLMTNADGSMSWAEGGSAGPSVTSVSYPGDDTAADPAGDQTVVLTGTGFAASGMAVSIGGTTAPSVAHDSNTQLTITTPVKAAGDYDIVVTNTVTGASGTFVNGISYNGIPSWTTTAGSLGIFESETTISTITLQATEPDGGTITFNITNGALPTGLSLTGANIDGTTTAESSTTLYSFTIEAIDDENQATPRNFSITVNAAEITPSENFTINTYTGNGSTQSIEGKIGTAASFNGSSSYIQTASNSVFSSQTFTVSSWINTNSNSTTQIIASTYVTAPGDSGWWFRLQGGVLALGGETSGGNVSYLSPNSYPTNTWIHVAVVKTPTSIKLYENGSEVYNSSSTNITFAGSSVPLTIGRLGNLSVQYFNGSIDQVRIFNRALSTDNNGVNEITTLYSENNASSTKSTTDIFGDGSGVALYEFEEGAKDTGIAPYGTGAIDSGQSAVFNGSSSSLISASGINNLSQLTASLWVKMNDITSANYFLGKYDVNDVREFFMYSGGGNFVFSIYYNGNNGNAITTPITVANDTWCHLALVSDGVTRPKAYINGVQTGQSQSDTTETNNYNATSVPLTIGNVTNNALGTSLNGSIDQVRIYSSALSASDIEALVSETNVPTANLVAHYKLDGNANDETGNYNGTPTSITYSDPAEFPLIQYNGTPTNVNFLGMAFAPDLIWVKNRTTSVNHNIVDSVRGLGDNVFKVLFSNTTDAENTTTYNNVLSLDSNGFTIQGAGSTTNTNGDDYVAWCWKAGGAAVSNTDGTITSTVSANPDAGFSIVKYQANSTQGATIGHGLSSAPEMIITKEFTGPRVWCVYHKDLTNSGYYLELNTTSGELNSLNTAYAGVPTSSTYSVGSSSVVNNPSTDSYIAYCFHSVDGYQKVGSYLGNNTTNVVTTGFQPRFVMVKASSHASSWYIVDSSRTDANFLSPDLSNAEYADAGKINFTSTGFTLTSTSYNNSGYTWIYLAIA